MATPTPFLGLYTIDLETEGSTKKVGAYLNEQSSTSNSNVIKIDNAIKQIVTQGVSSTFIVTGNGINKEFLLVHNKSSMSPLVSVFRKENNIMIVPEVEIVDENSVKVKFLFPPDVNEKYNVSIG
ncbi:MAG TPA: hypothetical protein DCM73_08270 [Clostridiales bacterium]|nr:hypothetical protein [Clostridiales bacterium]